MGRGRQPIRPKFFMSTGRPHHNGHLLQVKESLQPLTLYTFFHDLINVYSHRSGADNPRGQNFDVNRNLLSLQSFATSFKKISLMSDFIHFFSWFYTCIQPQGRGWQPPGNEILMSTGTSCHLGHLLQVSKKSLWSLILYNFFHELIHVYNHGGGADSPQGTKFWCQQKGLIILPICCKFQRNLFEVWFYTIFFMF